VPYASPDLAWMLPPLGARSLLPRPPLVEAVGYGVHVDTGAWVDVDVAAGAAVGAGGASDAYQGVVVAVDAVPAETMALDIGPKTVAAYTAALRDARTVFWNGPMGLFESAPFAAGTFDVARAMSRIGGFTVVGGGDSAAAVNLAGDDVAAGFNHISTGGGASLEFIEGKRMPGIEALRRGARS
jgi:3-phosphoglycerate kinase